MPLATLMRAVLLAEVLFHLAMALTTSPWAAYPLMFFFGAYAFVWGTLSRRRAAAGRAHRVPGAGRLGLHDLRDGRHARRVAPRRPDRQPVGRSPRRGGSPSSAPELTLALVWRQLATSRTPTRRQRSRQAEPAWSWLHECHVHARSMASAPRRRARRSPCPRGRRRDRPGHARRSTAATGPRTRAPAPPLAVVRAEDAAQVQTAVRWAADHRVPVVPRGAGTGLSGGASAVDGGIVLSLERMRTIEIDPDCQVAVVEPGALQRRRQGGRRASTGCGTRPTRRRTRSARSAATSPPTPAACAA